MPASPSRSPADPGSPPDDGGAVATDNVRMYAELEQRVQERTAELASFTSAVSHDLRAPVRQIEMYAAMLRETHADAIPAGCSDGLAIIAREAKQIGDMTDALLELSQIARLAVDPVPLDLAALARSVVVECRARFSHAVTFAAPESMTATMDPHLARIALNNLLDNAWKFTANFDHPRVELGQLVTAPGTAATFFLRDNGVGFDSTSAAHLFGMFKRMHKQHEYPGIGAGLATVHRVIKKHGGSIWAESQPDEGATFFFTTGDAG